MKLIRLLLVLLIPHLLFSAIETNSNSCNNTYSINQLDNTFDSTTYSNNYFSRWNSNKSIYLSFTTLVDGNLTLNLSKSGSSSMRYQLYIGKSCDDLSLVSNESFEYDHNTTIQIDKNQKYILKLIKEKNGFSRYGLSFNFQSLKPIEQTNGLVARYYNNTDFRGIPILSKIDKNIDFQDNFPISQTDNFSIKWSGYIYMPNDGDYHFRVNQDDAIRVMVNGENVYERYTSSNGKFQLSHKRYFKKGYYPIEVYYKQYNNSSIAKLAWVNYAISNELEIISNEKLFTYKPIGQDEIIHGHTLPPEPDKALNDSTLLGIDYNNNGVRDDVERWIYHTYRDKHPIHVDIAMQVARAYKKVLEMPEKAKEIYPIILAPLYCKMYYTKCVSGKRLKFITNMDSKYFRKKIYFNTQSRIDIYLKYDKFLSGDSYTLIRCSKQKQLCDFNTTKYEKY